MVRDSTIMFATFGFLIGALTIADVQWFEEIWMLVVSITVIGFLIAGFVIRHAEE